MSNPIYPVLCAKCLHPLTVTWPPQKHECSVVAVGPTLTCIPSDELDRLRAEVARLKEEDAFSQTVIAEANRKIDELKGAFSVEVDNALAWTRQQNSDLTQQVASLKEEKELKNEELYTLRAGIQQIADMLGVGDEPRFKWIRLEISALTQQLAAANEWVERDAELLNSGMILLTSTDENGDIFQTQHRGIDLRAAISAAIDASRLSEKGE